MNCDKIKGLDLVETSYSDAEIITVEN